MESATHPAKWKTFLAFFIIYFVWGSSFYGIRVGVREVPPLILASMRFTLAGFVLFAWMMAQGERPPTAREWKSIGILGLLIFVCDYGLLFWAEQRVPSGLAATMMATIPAFMSLSEIVILRTRRLTIGLAAALMIGIAGVAVLMNRTLNLGGTPIDTQGAMGLILAAISWSISSSLSRKLPLPGSKIVSSGAQMLTGGLFLAITAAIFGEFGRFHPLIVSRAAWLWLLYLIIVASIIGFTAYVWLIHHESPTQVGTYAYVNPVVAVLMGYFLGGESLGARTILGISLILISVVALTMTRPAPVLGMATGNSAEVVRTTQS